MKALKLFLFLLLIPVLSQAQNCSANPGGDRSICIGDPMILFGEDSEYYLDPLDVTWTILNTQVPVQLDNPNILQPTVTTLDGSDFEAGEYVFRMTVVCIDTEDAVADLVVTVGEILNPPAILAPYTEEAVICGSSVLIEGTPLDPGVTGIWLIEPSIEVTLTPSTDGSSVTVSQNSTNFNVCDYVLSYYQNIGSCEAVTSTKISFTQDYSNLTINNFASSCSRRVTLQGTRNRCNGTACWTQPVGQGANIFNTSSYFTTVEVPTDGNYTFCYTIKNGDCDTDEVCRTEFIGGSTNFDLGPSPIFAICQDNWDIDSYYFEAPFFADVTYTWSASSTIGSDWINIPSNATNAATITFDDISNVDLPNGLTVTITVRGVNSDGCVDIKNWTFFLQPEVSVTAENINLLCGGDPFFRINSYIQTNATNGTRKAQVIESPNPNLPTGEPAFFINNNTYLDLSVEGPYSFLITVSRTGIDPATGVFVTCTDETTLNVFVTNVPTIDAGSDIETCLLITQLNGNTPLDADGHPVDIPVSWELLSGQTGVVITSPDVEDPVLTGLEFGETYVFKYSFSSEPDCIKEDEITVTVLSKEACAPCEITAKVDLGECREGCVQAMVEGAETYLWVPSDGVDDPTSANPTICNSTGTTYTVYGFVNGEACGFAQVEVGCERPFDCDGFYVQQSCTTCSCGKPVVRLRLFDSNGNPVDDDLIDITWNIYGNEIPNGNNPFSTYYQGPAIYSVQIQYTNGFGEVCDTTISGVATCLGDCPNFSLMSCAELPNSENYSECYGEESYCDYGAGYLFVVDDLGQPVTDYFIDWGNGSTNGVNPNFVYTPDCGTVDVRVWSFKGCDTVITYDPDCCNLSAPMVECDYSSEIPQIRWPELCGSSYYEVEMYCLNGNGDYNIVNVSQISEDGYYYYTPDFSGKCNFWGYRVVGICESTGNYGNYSDCIFVDNTGYCLTDDYLCEFYFGVEVKTTDGKNQKEKGQARYAEILKELGWAGESNLYPNPVKGEEVYLNMAQEIVTGHEEVEVRVLGLDGKLFHSNWLQTSAGTNIISTDKLSSGLYFISIYSKEGELLESKRLVKN